MLSDLKLPAGIDGDRLLAAIADVETNGGIDDVPRFEASYMPAGFSTTVQGHVLHGTGEALSDLAAERFKEWGIWAAGSFSRWQILFQVAADNGYTGDPRMLVFDATALPFVVARLNHIASKGATTVRQFAQAWNTGHFTNDPPHGDYADEVQSAYDARETS